MSNEKSLKENLQKMTNEQILEETKKKSPIDRAAALFEIDKRRIKTPEAREALNAQKDSNFRIPMFFSCAQIAKAVSIRLGFEQAQTDDNEVHEIINILKQENWK